MSLTSVCLRLLSRLRRASSNRLFVYLYLVGALYGIYLSSSELPLSTLSCAIIVIAISTALLGIGFGTLLAFIVSASIVCLGSLEVHGIFNHHIHWRSRHPELKDSIEHALIYMSIMVFSWLGNRQTKKSLRRAERSEQALLKERDSLEKKVEERTKELKAAQFEKVSQLYRLAEFGRLSSGIFHDLMNSLTGVTLSIDRIADGQTAIGADAAIQIERAKKASRKMESFMHAVRKQLASERKQEIFAVDTEVRDAIDLVSYRAKSMHISMEIDMPSRYRLNGSPVRFFQVVVNLLSNAIDSFADLPKASRPRAIAISVTKKEGFIELSVSDNGCGIAKSVLPHIFDPFFTTKSKRDGTGLGLSTTKSIVEGDFGGSLAVTSVEGAGTTFVARFPKRC